MQKEDPYMKLDLKKLLRTAAVAAVVGIAVAGQPALAAELPGSGKTVRFAQSDSLGANYVTAQIVMKALEELGYKVKLSTVSTTLFFQAAAQGDLDVAADINFPQREPGYRAVEKDTMLIGDGMIVGGGINGYLIDKKTADQHHITTLEQMKDPKIAALFGAKGKAELINCDPGWSCGDVVDYQLDKFGLKDTVRSVRGKYEALMVEAVARVKRGEPAFFYAWSPSWMNKALVPGEDVVWLPTPFDALPPAVNSKGSPLVKGVSGCAGNADPCRMAMASWNWLSVANRGFIAQNPAVKKLLEEVKFPLETWSGWESQINKNGGSSNVVNKLADDWVKANKAQLDQWVANAKAST
jgi:glycine betaine/proline transport system substrate-binding protein